jgi:hypothetical protein
MLKNLRKGQFFYGAMFIIGVLLVLVAVILVNVFYKPRSKAVMREADWIKVMGDPEAYQTSLGFGVMQAFAIGVSPDDYVFIGGGFEGIVDFDPGPGSYNLSSVQDDFFLSKFDPEGNWIWSESWGPTAPEPGRATGDRPCEIHFDSSGNLLFSSFFIGEFDFDPSQDEVIRTSDMENGGNFISKFDGDGNFIDVTILPDDYKGNPKLFICDDDEMIISGVRVSGDRQERTSGMAIIVTYDHMDDFVARVLPDGSTIWIDTWSGLKFRNFFADGDGNVYFCGSFDQDFDIDPGPETEMVPLTSKQDSILVKLDTDGSVLWYKRIVFSDFTYAFQISQDSYGNVYIGGYSCNYIINNFDNLVPNASFDTRRANQIYHGFLVKFDSDGNVIWQKIYPEGTGLAVNNVNVFNNQIIFYGNLHNETDIDPSKAVLNIIPDAGRDPFICGFSLDGKLQWVSLIPWQWQNPDKFNFEGISGIASNSQGNIYATGRFKATSFLAMISNHDDGE